MSGANGTGGADGSDAPGRPRRERAGRRALFSDPTEGAVPEAAGGAEAPGRSGRRAFFSDPVVTEGSGRPPGPGGRSLVPGGGSLVVVCRTCRARTPMSLVELGLALVPSLWLPTRPWPRLMRCPSCHHVSWCRLERAAP